MTTESEPPRTTGGALLPAADASPDTIRQAAETIRQRVEAIDTPDLKEAQSEARRRRPSPGSDASAAWTELMDILGDELTRRDLAERTEWVRAVEEAQPLRRRILESLAGRRTTPSELSEALGVRRETVSRALAALAEEGLVVGEIHPGDGRRRVYTATSPVSVTDPGLTALVAHRAYGEPEQRSAPSPSAELALAHLAEALEQAVDDRRRGRRVEAIERLEAVVQRAEASGFAAFELRARRELMTTLRQDARWKSLEPHLTVLDDYAMSRRTGEGPVAAIAGAHYHYEVGRGAGNPGRSLRDRYSDLDYANVAYAKLARDHPHDAEWKTFRGWALLSIADNLRQQTYLGHALHHVERADALIGPDDPFGRARVLLLRGFCHRLRGQYLKARDDLSDALILIEEHGFGPFLADAHAQMGEVLRWLGDTGNSRKHFDAAKALGDQLNLGVLRSFAGSGKGAVAYAETDYDDAVRLLTESDGEFAAARHVAGQALNLRRLATARREVGGGHDRSGRSVDALYSQSLRLYFKMKSPAGLALCYVGRGRWQQKQGRTADLTTSCTQLTRLLIGDRAANRLLRLDPHAPTLVAQFVKEVAQSGGVGRSQLEGLEQSAKQLDADVKVRVEQGQAAAFDGDVKGLEMGGEPRCEADDGRWLAAVVAPDLSPVA